MTDLPQLRAMIDGYRVSAAIGVAADLGLSDLLVDGPRSSADLAAALTVDADALHRLLRVLAALGMYDEDGDGRFALSDLGEGLCSDVPGSLRPLARTACSLAYWSAWGHLGGSVRTGDNAFRTVHGVDVWTYRQAHQEDNQNFNDNMAALTSVVADAVAEAYDFEGLTSVVDVGGGQGVLLEAVLTRHQHLTGIVFDLEQAVARSPGSEALAGRWSAVSGSFFDAVPPADAYLAKSILHDWPDERCVAILETLRGGLRPDGVVLVVEALLGRPGHELGTALSDLNMLVMPGGRERSEREYAELFAAAGLALGRVLDTTSQMSILEARLAAS